MKKTGVWLIIIGIFFLSIDIAIPMGKAYPAMVKTDQIGELFQTNVISHLIESKPFIDIFNDLIGLLFIFLGSAVLIRKSRNFVIAMLLIPAASVLNAVIPQLPYHLQARELYLKVTGYSLLVVMLEILIEYFIMNGIITMTNCVQNKWHSNEMQLGWIIVMTNKGLLVLIKFFFGQNLLFIVYAAVMFAATVFFVNRLLKTLEFDPETISNAPPEI